MGRAFQVRKASMEKTAAARSKTYAKYGKEIYMAAKSGVPDPDMNQVLKRAIERAKKDQVSADVIHRAIEKAKGGSDDNYIAVRYEGFGPGSAQLVVECLTDNVNRTVAEVKTIFNKTGGKLGSVLHMFESKAVFTFKGTEDEILMILLDAGVDVSNYEIDEEYITLYADPTAYSEVRIALKNALPELEFEEDEIKWLPLALTELVGEKEQEQFQRLMDMLDELDDVQNVYHNVKQSE
jgi:YebC/PmpR family DNA-binding regulatory protein